MKFKLPTLSEEMDMSTGEVHSSEGELVCDLDLSIDCQTRWEENFPELSKNITFIDFVLKYKENLSANKNTQDVNKLAIELKIMYTCLIFENNMTFREFVRMFSSSNKDYLEKLVNSIKLVIDYIVKREEGKKKF